MARIWVHEHHNNLGVLEQITYAWDESDGDLFCWIDGGFLAEAGIQLAGDRVGAVGSIANIGPFRLRVIAYDPPWDRYTLMRDGWRAYLYAYLYNPLTRALELIYRRAVITLAVWGLADYHRGGIPTWRDIHLAQWLVERHQQLTVRLNKLYTQARDTVRAWLPINP